MSVLTSCPRCHGYATVPGDDGGPVLCPHCEGVGLVFAEEEGSGGVSTVSGDVSKDVSDTPSNTIPRAQRRSHVVPGLAWLMFPELGIGQFLM
jgi:hypothetical protein